MLGLSRGRRETGGAPNVTQCTRLKHPVSVLSSDCACVLVASM